MDLRLSLLGECSDGTGGHAATSPARLGQTTHMDTIRPYHSQDFDVCMALFDANVPAFFSVGERVDFAGFLIQHAAAWHYQLLERGNEIAGCAGYAINADGITASLCWGMVHPSLHRRGVGTQLLLARLDALRQRPDIRRVVLDTSQHTQQFYARFGFVVQQVTVDGYAPGLERWDMALDLQPRATPTGRARFAR